MSERATGTLVTQFSRQAPCLTSPVIGPTRWITLRDLRLAVATADFTQTVCIGVALHAIISADELASWKALAVGILIASVAIAIRRGLRRSGAAGRGSGSRVSRHAALSTMTSVCTAGAICWLLAPRATTEFILTWFIAWSVVSSLISAALRIGGTYLRKKVLSARRVVIVGHPAHTARLIRSAALDTETRWIIAGYIDTKEPDWIDRLYLLVTQENVDIVALALVSRNVGRWASMVCSRLVDQPVRVCLAIDAATFGRTPHTMERTGNAFLVDLLADPHGGLEGGAKRVMDVVLSSLALVVLSPLLTVVAAAVRMESTGPVLFRQKRFGLGGRNIEVFKFRSMYVDVCDVTGENRTIRRDPRVTRVGRIIRHLSLDELPQLFNVWRGDMSLVGPRPHPLHMRVGELYYFDAVERYRARHLVKPGITGWAQINGSRGVVDTIEKARRRVELDLWYLENWSMWLDFQIIIRTILGGFLSENFN